MTAEEWLRNRGRSSVCAGDMLDYAAAEVRRVAGPLVVAMNAIMEALEVFDRRLGWPADTYQRTLNCRSALAAAKKEMEEK